ncbi:uncharacterized protein LOC142767354 isoform X1 [Rhipicephalus microplus]|uniref:uncharacterized protein LOC142767354 isoform X1 n=1 Tax=Rhipicephalus microplus TaxID=6941 RepID=UPI003F6BAD0D
MNPDFKVRNDSPSGPLHLAHSTNKLWSFAYVTHSLLRELPVSNILHRSIGPLCLPACSHAALQSHRWMLHPNPHSLLRLAWTSWVGKSITVLLSARNSHPGFCLLLALLGRHHTKKPISLWRRLFGSASRCSTVVASGWMKSVLRTTSLIAPRDMPAIY